MTRRKHALPPTAPAHVERRLREDGRRLIAGVDEAGRGCLAGPVVAAAVIMPAEPAVSGVTDSKLLSPARRERLAVEIRALALSCAVGVVSAADIDATDIVRATHRAMRAALAQLDPPPDFIVVDGRPVPGLPAPCESIVGGDRLCYSIAAASILAKVHRDRLMLDLDIRYPGYGLARHKGYGTHEHRAAILRLGPCAIHRMTFEPMKSAREA